MGTTKYFANGLAVYEQTGVRKVHIAHTGGCDLPAQEAETVAKRIAVAMDAHEDLLTACKTALYWAERTEQSHYPERNQGLANVRAAIAKAGGT